MCVKSAAEKSCGVFLSQRQYLSLSSLLPHSSDMKQGNYLLK